MIRKILCISMLMVSIVPNLFSKAEDDKKDYYQLGAVVRFNTAFESYEQSKRTLDTYMKFDTWYLSLDSRVKGFDLSVQYRFYPESKTHFLHHAYMGYDITKDLYAKLGVFQKPFGIDGAASHSWWFQAPYYLGLEDTYNTGVGLTYDYKKFKFDFAYFRQAAPRGPMSNDTEDTSVGNARYSYTVVPSEGADIRELDQFNGRVRYQAADWLELGLSGQLGGIYNKETNRRKWAFAGAAHAEINYQRWNFKGEIIGYNYKAENDLGKKMPIVQMAAYGTAYDVAARAVVYVAGLSYDIPVNRRFIQNIRPYLDYSVVKKTKSNFHSTQQLVPGVMITSGPIYTYVDCALGNNHPALTSYYGEGLGKGKSDARWNCRVNINIGYYFSFKR